MSKELIVINCYQIISY